jgi:hypothetical protein
MSVTIDISDEELGITFEIASDCPGGDMFTIRLGDTDLCVNWEQLRSIYRQVKPWFEDIETDNI